MDWLTTILSYVPQTAIPIVVVAIAYLKINSDRKNTKVERDKDSLEIHDRILKHDFIIGQIKDNLTLYQTVQEDLKTELNILNTNVAKLTVVVDSLRDTVKELKQK
jgi:hypothetical protein